MMYNQMHSPTRSRSGAALLIAVAIIAILTVFAVVFSLQSRVDMNAATNFSNDIRADLIGDAATAIAIAFLDHDRDVHPTVTALDHAWRTYFDGTWIAGKEWAFDDPAFTWLTSRDVLPLIDANHADLLGDALYIPRTADGSLPPVQDLDEPFLIIDPPSTDLSGNLRTRAEQIHRIFPGADPFTDVDSDGDGLRDAMWIPIPADSTFGGIDIDGDGIVSVDEGGDGIDNDLDGTIDEPGELAPFVYWGGNDGLDNNGDGDIDELQEQKIFLTAPLRSTNPFGLDAVGTRLLAYPFDILVNEAVVLEFSGVNYDDSIPPAVEADNLFGTEWDTIGLADLDQIDNDYDFIVNNDAGESFDALVDLNGDGFVDEFDTQVVARQLGLNLINTDPGFYENVGPVSGAFIGAKGDPVCFIAGRAAILITDEASKVNIDVAGAHMPNEHFSSLERYTGETSRPVRRALSQGIGTHEYDLRVLPDIGSIRSTRLWDFRMGISDGDGLLARSLLVSPGDKVSTPVNLDVSLPGYGGVDDNMSSLWMAVIGLDDDGDAEIYQNDNVDNDLNGFIDEAGEGILVGVDEGLRAYDYDGDGDVEFANFEGVDDPGEFQLYRPLRNVYLEEPFFNDIRDDDDDDGVIDEFGEASDRVYHARDQLMAINGIGGTTYDRLSNLVTAHSLDGGGRYQHYSPLDGSRLEEPVLSGLKLNPNYAMAINPNNAHDPGQFAHMLIEDWYYPPSTEDAQQYNLSADLNLSFTELNFMAGLRQEDVGMTLVPFASGTFGTMPPDQELRALRLGATLQDFRDSDHVRTEASLAVEDVWYFNQYVIPGINPTGSDAPRQIEYKMAGIESIRINEIMVRAVRRIEAEATTDPFNTGNPVLDFDYNALRDANSLFTAALDTGGGFSDFDISVENFETGGFYTTAPLAAPGSSGWRLTRTGGLGEDEAFITDQALLTDGTNRSDVIQFRFRPGINLPPGRYYLMVNVMDAFGFVNQDFAEGDIEYAIKYISTTTPAWPVDADPLYQKTAGTSDILTDVDDQERLGTPGIFVPWNQIDPALPAPIVGENNHPGGSRKTGFVFLPSNAQPNTLATPFAGYGQNGAFTVEIPPFSEDVELCVAIRFPRTNAIEVPTLSLNFFDFSQEPDHEYIEIVNIEEPPANLSADNVDVHAIDLSGWEIEVGDSNTDSNAIIMSIPFGTRIAPGDSLLLAVNKFDGGIDGNGQTLFNNLALDSVSDIFKNGMGLVRGPRGFPTGNPGIETTNAFGWVTEPSMPRVNGNASAAAGWNVPLNYVGSDIVAPTGAIGLTGASVFFRPVDRELVDSNGDGVDDFDLNTAEPLANASLSTPEAEPSFGIVQPTAFGAAPQDFTNPAKAWDRIVQLEIANNSVMFFTEDAEEIGRLVLRGGVFPNYPELDGIDNDGDNGFLEYDDLDNDGDFDGNDAIDADGDGLFAGDIEVSGNLTDDDNDGFVDEAVFEIVENVDEEFEGVDEGYVRRYIRNVSTFLPVSGTPGGYDDAPVFFTQLNDASGQPVYLTNFNQSPDWKAFVERRFFPGDNVVVTLYDGSADRGRVVDRVTYNQRDVENVAIDDDVNSPFLFNGQLAQAWPPNTMGLDFYRSLERKHPLYAGDRFGTRNRLTATDGNYDDWSRGTNRFDDLLIDEFGPDPQTNPTVSHGLSGSPLRMNFYQRVLENPNDQFLNATPLPVDDHRWIYDYAKVRNRNLASAGDLMTMSHITFAHGLYTDVASFETTPNFAATAQQFGIGPLVGMDFPKDLEAMVTNTSFDAVNLSVGQADFYPLYPTADHVFSDVGLTQWNGSATPVAAPRAWSPVFLFPLDFEADDATLDFTIPVSQSATDPGGSTEALFGHLFGTTADTYPFYKYFMFQSPGDIGKIPAGYDPTVHGGEELFDRWPLDRRAVAYVSKNPQNFNPSADVALHNSSGPLSIDSVDGNEYPSEALFVWQGEDGLQNGRYDAYIVTMDNLDDVAFAHIESGDNLLTPVGGEVVGAMHEFVGDTGDLFGNFQELGPENFGVDIAFFTDLNGDRRCWTDRNNNGLPDMVDGANELNFNAANAGTFGRIDGLIPTRDGIIHYGAVEVKNNYLALFIRNWATNTATNRITRVVLAPRRAASGRINVNTAVTRRMDNNELFNPLMGIPGVMVEPGGFVSDSANIDLPNAFNQTLSEVPGMSIRADGIVRYRQERGVKWDIYGDAGRVIASPMNLLDRFQLGFSTPQSLSYPQSIFGEVSGPVLADDADPSVVGEQRFIEMQARMSLLANFVTTRSDVFEIIVTAQPGYVADNNGDGVLNWRDDREFVPTGEVKRRVIYERSQGDPDGARQ